MIEPTLTAPLPDADPDLVLLHAIAAGDARALDMLYARHGPYLLGYLLTCLNDRAAAEEVLQDVMLAVWQHAAGFRGESKVRTWMLTIARNRAINRQRRHAPALVSLDDGFDSPSPDTGPMERVERATRQQALQEALRRLPAEQREILDLVFYQQLSGPEVADVLQITLGTVKSRLHRAKEALRRTLQVMGEQSDAS